MIYYYYDKTYLLVIIGAILVSLASSLVNRTFDRYDQVENEKALSGAEAARLILDRIGLANLPVERVSGRLSDHYDPSDKVLRLSSSVYDSRSIAAVAVAAHECGHAQQDQESYLFLKLRNKVVLPLANLGSRLGMPMIVLGLIFSLSKLVKIGILALGLALLFQIVTLPVEINASRRALGILKSTGITGEAELPAARKVLTAAALTYVASTLSSALQLIRLVLLNRRRSDDD